LRSARIVKQRREGKHIYYSLADEHVAVEIANALAHAEE
jgi:ArsR family transcriptional regulator, lead/cadmium/zinc/bismuth-responsive transcriptional repressor